MAQNIIDNEPNADDLLDRLLYWGHSHVNMGVTPSGIDKDTLLRFDDGQLDFFLVAILTKKGEFRYDVAFSVKV